MDDRYHHSQFNCLDCPLMKSRFMFLISNCKFIAGRKHSHVFGNVLTKRSKQVFNQTDDCEPHRKGGFRLMEAHRWEGLIDLLWDTSRTKMTLYVSLMSLQTDRVFSCGYYGYYHRQGTHSLFSLITLQTRDG